MKYFIWFGGVVVALFGSIYLLVFTSFGNKLLTPLLQTSIQKETKLQSKVTTFSLTMSDFEIALELSQNNTLLLKGEYSLFSQDFNITYDVRLNELESLEPLTQIQLQGIFHTQGSIVGEMAFMKIEGVSDVAHSHTSYYVELTELEASSIIAKVQDADLAALLYLLGQKEYASATINLDANFKNITPKELDGNIVLQTKNGKLNTAVMQKDFNITIPSTAFEMNLVALLAGESANYTYRLSSNLAKLTSSGDVTPEPLALDIKYGVDIKELGVLKPLTNADIRGALRLSGDVKGDKKELVVTGLSDIASSESSFRAVLKEFVPANVSASVKNMKLQEIFYMLRQPHYADGLLSLNAEISDANPESLKGVVSTSVSEGLLDSQFITKEYAFSSLMPTTHFSAKAQTQLSKKSTETKLMLMSTLANLDVKSAKFAIDDATFLSDYVVKVHDLNRLHFLTKRNLKGSLAANGELKIAKDLDFSLFSDIAGGKLKATLHNDDLVANINTMQTLAILDMLIYPKIFDSSINGVMRYNLGTQKGDFKAALQEGKFTQNQVLDLAKNYASINLYNERFVGDVNAKIDKEKIVASLDLKSNRSRITTKDTKINSQTKDIDTKIDINADGTPLKVAVSGNIYTPSVSISAEELIKKELNKFLKGLF